VSDRNPDQKEDRNEDPDEDRVAGDDAARILDPSTSFYSPNPHLVDANGPGGSPRRILMGWILQGSPAKGIPYWEGLHAIPRVLALDGRGLVQAPIPELEVLRRRHLRLEDRIIDSPAPGLFPTFEGDALEIRARFDRAGATATRFGVEVRRSRDGKEKTTVAYEPAADTFGVGGLVARRPGSLGETRAALRPDEPVEFRIFLDRSVLEVFVNGRTITERMFPSPGSRGIEVFAEGGRVRLATIDIWQMASIYRIESEP
ncbi:MAG: glycoside hydrolase family 32 protein, partial [Planctomycetes bacterium]|nr:glycoside hydrolase family 32 protein [Planctomycetota bacterium]